MAASLEELQTRHNQVMAKHKGHIRISKFLLVITLVSALGSGALMIPTLFADGKVCSSGCSVSVGMLIPFTMLVGLALGLALRQINRGARAYNRAQRILLQIGE